jgi:hypothetical protein
MSGCHMRCNGDHFKNCCMFMEVILGARRTQRSLRSVTLFKYMNFKINNLIEK